MISLTRQSRFFWRPAESASHPANAWSGAGVGWEVAPWMQLQITVSGEPKQPSGYLCDIKQLDDLCQTAIQQTLQSRERFGDWTYHEFLFAFVDRVRELAGELPTLQRCELRVSPYLSFIVYEDQPNMLSICQQFEFSAAHRLHCPEFTDEQNRELFGKCNNPAGHGHNYVVEITLGSIERDSSEIPFSLPGFESQVKSRVIDRLDHRHLNEQVPEFKNVNPSVENIAVVIWGLLDGHIEQGHLKNVRVYETPKTWADYSGPT